MKQRMQFSFGYSDLAVKYVHRLALHAVREYDILVMTGLLRHGECSYLNKASSNVITHMVQSSL